MGTQKNRLNETVLLSTQKHMFKLMGNEINAISGAQTVLLWTYGIQRVEISYEKKRFSIYIIYNTLFT